MQYSRMRITLHSCLRRIKTGWQSLKFSILQVVKPLATQRTLAPLALGFLDHRLRLRWCYSGNENMLTSTEARPKSAGEGRHVSLSADGYVS